MTDKEKLEKIKELADAMYYAAGNLGPNVGSGERLRKTMGEYHKFIINEYHKEEPVSEKKCMFTKDNYTDEDRKVLCDGCEEKCKFNKKEEPTSEDLEQAIDTYLVTYFGGEKEKQDWPFLKKMAIHFANWQKKKDNYAIEIAHMAGEEEGKNIMKQQMLAKAVKVNISNASIVPLPVNCNLKVGDKVLLIKE